MFVILAFSSWKLEIQAPRILVINIVYLLVEFSACNTITGRTVELTVAQITIINILHEESEPQKVTPEKAHCLCCIETYHWKETVC